MEGLNFMTLMPTAVLSPESLALDFFRQSAGEWKSQRRYYTLKQDIEPEEVVSMIGIRFLTQGSDELTNLAQAHQLESATALLGGTEVIWESNYIGKSRQPSTGKTVFGILGNILYRDRGFATDKPVTAIFTFTNPQTMCLKTEYGGSVFTEELKLIGQQYRTRQTIISRAQEEIMIGQYLEKRL
jgi:hypothetical protein